MESKSSYGRTRHLLSQPGNVDVGTWSPLTRVGRWIQAVQPKGFWVQSVINVHAYTSMVMVGRRVRKSDVVVFPVVLVRQQARGSLLARVT